MLIISKVEKYSKRFYLSSKLGLKCSGCDWLDTLTGVALGSDAFFSFGDNIERAHKSGDTGAIHHEPAPYSL